MKVIDFGQTNSILNQYISEIRNVEVQNDRLRFRRNIERIGEIMAYEISKDFTYSKKGIQSPLGIAPMNTPDDSVVISTILRAGLPYHQGFLSYLDNAENAFVSAYRKYKDLRYSYRIHRISPINRQDIDYNGSDVGNRQFYGTGLRSIAHQRPPGAYPCRFHHCQQAGNRISPA